MTGEIATVDLGDGYQVSSSTSTEEQIRETFADDKADETSEAARKLGSRGGKAAAAARAERAQATADAPEGEPAGDAAPEGDADAPKDNRGKPRHDPVARMKEATRKEAEAKRQLAEERQARAAAEQRAAALEASQRAPRPDTTQQPRTDPNAAPGQPQRARQALPEDPNDPRPKEADYADYGEFMADVAAWSARRTLQEQHARAAQRRDQAEGIRRVHAEVEDFNSRLAEAEKASPDLRERLSEDMLSLTPTFGLPPGARPTPLTDTAAIIFRSSAAPALLLHFSEHPEELQRFAQLPSRDAVVGEMAKLEARLSAATTGPSVSKPPVSKARPPVTPVTGAPATTSDEPTDQDDYDTWTRKRDAEDAQRRRARSR